MLKKSFIAAGVKVVCSVLGLSACLSAGATYAADQGARQHAQGQCDTVTATYTVIEGDDLIAITGAPEGNGRRRR